MWRKRVRHNSGIKRKISEWNKCRINMTEFRDLRVIYVNCYSFLYTQLSGKNNPPGTAHHATRMSDACMANWYPCFTPCNVTWCIITSRIRRHEWIITHCTRRRGLLASFFVSYVTSHVFTSDLTWTLNIVELHLHYPQKPNISLSNLALILINGKNDFSKTSKNS